MQLLSLLDRAEQTQYLILNEFYRANGPLSLNQLQKKVTGSANYLAKQTQLVIDRCQHHPKTHWTLTENGWRFDNELDFKLADIAYELVEESVNFQLLMQLFTQGHLNFFQILNDYAISEPTYYRRIKDLNDLLKEFNLKIASGHLVGTELQIRYFFFQLFLKATPFQEDFDQKTRVGVRQIRQAIEAGLEIELKPFERYCLTLLVEIFYYSHFSGKETNIPLVCASLAAFESYPNFLLLQEILRPFLMKQTEARLKEETALLYIFLHSFHILPYDLKWYQEDYQRMDDSELPELQENLLNRASRHLSQTFAKMFVGTPLKRDDDQLIHFAFMQMAYYLTYFKGGYLNYDTEEYLSMKNVVVLSRLQIGSNTSLESIYHNLGLEYDLDDNHTHLMYNRYLALFINIYQRHPLPLLMGFNYQGWPLARDTLLRYLQDTMFAQHVVVEEYQPGQKYDMVVTNVASEKIKQDAYAEFVISDVVTEKQLRHIFDFISYRREHFQDYERILPYL